MDTVAPAIAVTEIAEDGIINTAEQAGGFDVNGTSDAEAGQIVTVTIDGVDSGTGAVQADGTWTVSVLPGAVAGLLNGDTPIFAARVEDQAGNPAAAAPLGATVDLTPPTIAVTQLGGDGFINIAEHGTDGIEVAGTTDAEDGQDVEVTLTQGGTTATTTVQANGGTFTAPFTPVQLADFIDGAITATATVENAIGNTGTSAGFGGTVDLIAPTISISDPLAGDGTFTKLNEANGLDVTGTTNAEVGQIVTVTYNGDDYTGAVVDGAPGLNTFTVPIPDTAFAGVDTGDSITGITARVSDQAGNPSDVATGPTLTVDLTGPSITIDLIAGDDIINIAESADPAGVEITGTASGAEGQPVTVTIIDPPSIPIFNETVTADPATGVWTAIVPTGTFATGANNSSFIVFVSVDDFEGVNATATRPYFIDLNNPTIAIDALPFGAFLNALDTETAQDVTGTSIGANGQQVTVIVTDSAGITTEITGMTDATTGAWSIPLDTTVLQALDEGTANLSATVNSAAGNPTLAPAVATFDVDITPPEITLNALPFGDFLNAADVAADQTISGTAPGAEGQQVTVTVTDGTTTVTLTPTAAAAAPGAWTVDLTVAQMATLTEAPITVSATVSDLAGNPAAAPAEATFTKDVTAPTVTITEIAGDGIVNITEQADGFAVNGTTDPAEEGRTVTVTIDGGAGGTGTVGAGGVWSVPIPDAVSSTLTTGTSPEFAASITDAAGNTGTSGNVAADVDLVVPTITFNTLAGDDILNIAESGMPLVVSGTSTSFAENDEITITAAGIDPIVVAVDASGNFTTTISVDDLADLITAAGAGPISFAATGTNTIGNAATPGGTDLTLALTPPALAIGDIEGTGGTDLEGVINIDERALGLEINGTSDADGQIVTVTLTDGAGFTETATGTVTGGAWQADFIAGTLDGLPDGTTQISVTAEVTDTNGNGTTTAPTTIPTDFIAPDVTIASVESGGEAIGDFINIDERDAGITVSGGSDLPENTTVTVTLTAGAFIATATGTTAANGDWSAVFEGQAGTYDLELLEEGAVSIVATADDAAGNTGTSASADVVADLTPPVIFLDAVGDEGVYDRSQGPLTLTGTTDAEAGQVVTVTFEGVDYSGTVTAGGGSGGAPNTWALTDPIPTTVLNGLGLGTAFSASATVSDLAGNASVAPATVDVVPYASGDTYLTEVTRIGPNDIRIGIFIDPRSPLLTDEAYALGETLMFETSQLQYLGGAVYDNTHFTMALNFTDTSDIASGRIGYSAIWVEDEFAGTVAVPNPEVARVQFNMRDLSEGSEIVTMSLENDQGTISTIFIGTAGDDTLTATNTDAVIQGRGGDDTIDVSAGGVNTVIFEAAPSANGLDTITGFSVAPDTALPDRIGFAGLDNSTLRGNGTDFEALADGDTLGADTGFVVLTFDLLGLTAGDLATAAANLVGEAGGDVIYLLATDGTDAALARVEYTAVNTATAEIMANFTGLGDLSGITANEILGFNTV